MYIWGYQTPVFIPIGSKKLHFQLNFSIFKEQMYIWGTKLQILSPLGQKKLNFQLNFSIFREQMYIWGYQKTVFIPNLYDRVKKNIIFSEIFPFLGNKCTFGGTKLQFLSPSGQKNCHFQLNFSIFREQMYIWGYQTPVFIPNLYDRVKKNIIFSEIFPFLGNKCTFGATKLQFLSQSGQ